MTATEIIEKKKRGETLDPAEIEEMVGGFLEGRVSEGQMAAFLMAVCWRGMEFEETAALTMAMARSGEMLDLTEFPHCADKHSTGGVGDKTTLVACPIAAAAGVTVAKMAGRSLGHTGGTIDKLESIPGLRTDLTPDEFLRQAREIGLVIAAQSRAMVPADKAIYALRDATATVDSIPLIASSIMSKKLAAGAPAIVLDVKYGRGAFMGDRQAACQLAIELGNIGKLAGRRVATAISSMDQPLGRAVGNALEVAEALEVLSGAGPSDVRDLSLFLASMMIWLSGRAESHEEARPLAEQALASGAAREKFLAMVAAQGGDPENLSPPQAPIVLEVRAERDGFIRTIDAREIGEAAWALAKRSAGRTDSAAGIVCILRMGDAVRAGDVVAAVHAGDDGSAEEAACRIAEAFSIGDAPSEPNPIIAEWLSDND